MKILIIEDRGSVGESLREILEKEGNEVEVALNLIEANNYLFDNKADCLIVDLNLSPEGLDEKYLKNTEMGKMTGWIWLKNYYLKNNKIKKDRIIIYTEYLDDLKRYASSSDLKFIKIISKRSYNSTEKLVFHIKLLKEKIYKGL